MALRLFPKQDRRRHSPVALRLHSPAVLKRHSPVVHRLAVLRRALRRHSPVGLRLRLVALRPDRAEDNLPGQKKTSLIRRKDRPESEKTPGSRKGPGVFCLTFLQT